MSTDPRDALLAAMEKRLAETVRRLDATVARLDAMENASGLFVDEASLDLPGGDPIVKFEPRSWRGGGHFVERKYSECSPEFLECLALAVQTETAPRDPERLAKWERFRQSNLTNASRARSWARRIRARGPVENRPAADPQQPATRPTGGRPGGARPQGGRPTGGRPGSAQASLPIPPGFDEEGVLIDDEKGSNFFDDPASPDIDDPF